MTTTKELRFMTGLAQGTTDRVLGLLAERPCSLADLVDAGISRVQAEKAIDLLRLRKQITGRPASRGAIKFVEYHLEVNA